MPEPRSPRPIALVAADAPPRAKPSNYPEPFASRIAGRDKRPLGDLFGLTNFGVNLTRLAPGAPRRCATRIRKQDEFVYILEGAPTLVTDAGRKRSTPGMCAGFKAGTGDAHHLVNETARTWSIWRSATARPGDGGDLPRRRPRGRGRRRQVALHPQGRDALRLTLGAIAPGSRYRRRGPWLRRARSACPASWGGGPSETARRHPR